MIVQLRVLPTKRWRIPLLFLIPANYLSSLRFVVHYNGL